MFLYLELWKAKEAWRSLSPEDRGAYIEQIGPHIEELLGRGVELVGIGTNDPGTDQRADYDYWAVWKMPDEELVEAFEAAVREDRFYDYFEQINACGRIDGPEGVFGQMIGA